MEIGLAGGTCTRGILLPRQACWLLHYDQMKMKLVRHRGIAPRQTVKSLGLQPRSRL